MSNNFNGSWYDYEEGFCESIDVGAPEYANSISSIVLLFYGLAGLFISRNHNIMMRMASGMLATTGIGSIVYHWTLLYGWSNIDGIPMLIASYMGAYICIDCVLYKKTMMERKNKREYEIYSGILAFVLMLMLSFSIVLSTVKETKYLFTIFFLIPELLIGLSIMTIRFWSHNNIYIDLMNGRKSLKQYIKLFKIESNNQQIYHDEFSDNTEEPLTDENMMTEIKSQVMIDIVNNHIEENIKQKTYKNNQIKKAFRTMWIGFGVSVGAAIIWFSTELVCHQEGYQWMKYLYTHVIWHCGIGLGMYFLMQFLIFINGYNFNYEPFFMDSDNKYLHWFYEFVPAINYKKI